ncbi:hypothetical protein OEG84_25195 [Hoeflea sp. G2-23]|uniref:Chromosomal replication initiator DnaA C-terminal domain-containing protein n=1 Tax=Hoeflea algicola TaxID=2983763 RepID=A0ABT3ZGG3_9HYPH|nr:helix-turn-helix domain-containing protein [Hoeflea algicola]MCY0150905.1 hypothetical protein [Hoeflea algicola]
MNALEQEIMRGLPPRVRKIVADESDAHGVPIHVMFSPSRQSKAIMARWAAMYRIREGNPRLSFPKIGDWFGRNHTTVLSGVARYAAITGKPKLTEYDISSRVDNPALYNGMQL